MMKSLNDLDKLRSDGIMRVTPFPRPQLNEFIEYLKSCSATNHHVFAQGSLKQVARDVLGKSDWPIVGHSEDDVRAGPHHREYITQFQYLANDYCAHPVSAGWDPWFSTYPNIVSTNAFWTQPSGSRYRDTHDWHRDPPGRSQFTLFVFGTDVLTLEDGAHNYECGSHSVPSTNDSVSYNYAGYKPTRPIETITGPAGTAFIVDSHGFHLGHRPQTAPRLLLVTRWG